MNCSLMQGMLILEYNAFGCTSYVCKCAYCQKSKDHCRVLNTQLGSLKTNNLLDLLCLDFTKINSLIRLLSLFVYIMNKTGTAVNKVKPLLKS